MAPTKISLNELKSLIGKMVKETLSGVGVPEAGGNSRPTPSDVESRWAHFESQRPPIQQEIMGAWKYLIRNWENLDDQDREILKHYPGWEKADFQGLVVRDLQKKKQAHVAEIQALDDEIAGFRS